MEEVPAFALAVAIAVAAVTVVAALLYVSSRRLHTSPPSLPPAAL